jgi:hypothetical protein
MLHLGRSHCLREPGKRPVDEGRCLVLRREGCSPTALIHPGEYQGMVLGEQVFPGTLISADGASEQFDAVAPVRDAPFEETACLLAEEAGNLVGGEPVQLPGIACIGGSGIGHEKTSPDWREKRPLMDCSREKVLSLKLISVQVRWPSPSSRSRISTWRRTCPPSGRSRGGRCG